VGILEGEGGRRAILPRLRAQVVVEARAGGHRLGVEVGGEGAVLQTERQRQNMSTTVCDSMRSEAPTPYSQPAAFRNHPFKSWLDKLWPCKIPN